MKVLHAHQLKREPKEHMPVIHAVLKIMADMRAVIAEGQRDRPVLFDYDRKVRQWLSDLEETQPEMCLKGGIDNAKRKRLQAPRRKDVREEKETATKVKKTKKA